ncbi:Methyltransferase domain-containing protein [Neofusicoccum parvum]|nr:Methyltransferase domain-containing protein [Neofusicoccum parvum]
MASPTPKDTTFRNYTSARADAYAAARGSYPTDLYAAILARHEQTAGQFGTLLDVGCGPGNAARDLAPAFDHAVGCDPGEAMVATARKLGGKTRAGEDVRWEVRSAEECAAVPGLGAGSVDLLTAAMAAHWFEMPLFWRQAAEIVKPGGSVAIFAKADYFCHPSDPNAEQVQRVFDEFERDTLAPYYLPGNHLCRNFYKDLQLPWQSDDPTPEFPEERFERHLFNLDGAMDGPDGKDYFGGSQTVTLKQLEKMMGTASIVTKWRDDHPEDVGTERDIVKIVSNTLEDANGGSDIRIGCGFVILFFKRHTLYLHHILSTQPPTTGARISLIDVPHNDWNTLTRTLLAHLPTHRPLLPSLIPSTFHAQVLPTATVDIGVSWSALHFLSRAPAPLAPSATDAELLARFVRHSAATAHADLVGFLAHRARETRAGGVFAGAMLAHVEADGATPNQAGVIAATVAARREFVARGRLGAEVAGVLVPARARARAEVDSALGEVGGWWAVEACVVEEVVHPAYEVLVAEVEAGGGEEAYRRYAGSVARWWVAALGGMLTGVGVEGEETVEEKRVMEELTERIAEIFFEKYRDDPTKSANWFLRLRRK